MVVRMSAESSVTRPGKDTDQFPIEVEEFTHQRLRRLDRSVGYFVDLRKNRLGVVLAYLRDYISSRDNQGCFYYAPEL